MPASTDGVVPQPIVCKAMVSHLLRGVRGQEWDQGNLPPPFFQNAKLTNLSRETIINNPGFFRFSYLLNS